MANSYNLYTANGSTTDFSLVGIDGWISSGFLKVYVNDTLQTTGYTFQDLTTAAPFVRFASAPANQAQVRLQRETPNTVASFQANVVDFNDGSVLTASDLDKVVTGLVHVAQEAEDTGSGALGLNTAETNWNAENKRLTNMADGIDAQDAITVNQFTIATLYGGSTVLPQVWYFNGNGGTTYTLSPAPLSTSREMFLVEVGGVLQQPSTYTITSSSIIFNSSFASTVGISVRNFGVSRNIIESVNTSMIQASAVTTAKINDAAVTTAKINDAAVTTAKIVDDAVTYAKMQPVSATNKVLGRSTAGAGDVEEISCTSAGRDIIAATDASAQRTLLQLGPFATKTAASLVDADLASNSAIGYGKLAQMSANALLGNNTGNAATPTAIACTAFARSLLDDADAAAGRATLGAVGAVSASGSVTSNAAALTSIATVGQWVNFSFTPSASVNVGFSGQTWLLFMSRNATDNQFGVAVISGVSVSTTVCANMNMLTTTPIYFAACRIA